MQNEISRRSWMAAGAIAGGMFALVDPLLGQQAPSGGTGADGPYVLPPLGYDYADLEPHINAQIMKLHYSVHHAGYVRGANEALIALEAARRAGGDEIRRIRAHTDALAFNLAGHVLHTIFWGNMTKGGGGDPASGSEIARLIQRDFGSQAAFVGHFSAAAAQVQGNGWAMLVYDPLGQRVLILQAEKHQVNLVPTCVPLLVLDVWEHAYYLQYQNVRTNYIKAFFNVVSWANVDQRLTTAMAR